MTFRPLTCPQCGRRTVAFAFRPNSEDNYYCFFRKNKRDGCGWYAFTLSNSPDDVEQLRKLRLANPNVEI